MAKNNSKNTKMFDPEEHEKPTFKK